LDIRIWSFVEKASIGTCDIRIQPYYSFISINQQKGILGLLLAFSLRIIFPRVFAMVLFLFLFPSYMYLNFIHEKSSNVSCADRQREHHSMSSLHELTMHFLAHSMITLPGKCSRMRI
jgi:hypothetical protein